MPDDEAMDVPAQVDALNKALRLQHRSVPHYALTAGSIVGYLLRAQRGSR